ncbi:unnamed protein product [Ilex paraguariensis]|uniref:Protein kinase domain-containing protein n=1 Tax=Ilex paraguariensis TaxID=185542 RepID=A0ABC8U373_9AQUA
MQSARKLFYLLVSLVLSLPATAHIPVSATDWSPEPPPVNLLFPSDADAILSFKFKADLDNKLLYTHNEPFDYCSWQGVKCVQGRVFRFVLQSFGLRGTFPAGTLTRLDQLRVLCLNHNSLTGPIPDFSSLVNLETLFLDHNSFSGTFPLSFLFLHRLRALDLSRNNFTGPLPLNLTVLDRLNYLRLDSNRFNDTIPPLNQSFLQVFNVSNNDLTGPIPVTSTLSHFDMSPFTDNPNVCGKIINKPCRSSPFSESPSSAASPPEQLNQNSQGQLAALSPSISKTHKRIGIILGLVIGVVILIAGILSLFALLKNRRYQFDSKSTMYKVNTNAINTTTQYVNTELDGKEKQPQVPQFQEKIGNFVFCAGERQLYTLEQLMKASAELLGRGTIGSTYKAVMDYQLIVCVKRLDAGKTKITSGERFERHMEGVGGLRHPNLVAVRAYFQAKQEKLIIYDYQANGSLFNLLHGSRSARTKPLHWTSCLKIAEDVAMGLVFIHQKSKLIHGNLKSTNVLLGPDFEACLADYCLAILADSTSNDDPDLVGYKAPEIRKSNRQATFKSDVYAFGILLLEILTGKPPSQHPILEPSDLPNWVRATREDDSEDINCLGLLVEVAGICSSTSPEQRPAMWQVLKMIEEKVKRCI